MLHGSLWQVSMEEVNPDEIGLAEDSFERHLPQVVPQLVPAEEFREFYCEENGAGSRCPLTLTAMLLLQHRYGVSDRELVERCRRDLGWRYAIGLKKSERPPGQATLQRFRSKLFRLKGRDFLHMCSLRLAKDAGLIEDFEMQAVDSTNTECRGAVIDTFNLISAGIRQVVRTVAMCLGCAAGDLAARWELSRYMARSVKGQVSIDWSDERARNALITEEVTDADRLPGLITDLGVTLPSEVAEAVALLSKVAHQDVERLDDGSYRIARGTAPGRVISITDPEARHGRKSASKAINGFKTHVIGTMESQFVTGIAVTDASVHDSVPTVDLIHQADAAEVKPKEVVGDTAYGTGANIRRCNEVGVAILTKEPAPSTKTSIPKQSFDIDLEQGTATCPEGHGASRVTQVKDPAGSDQRVLKFHFPKEVCQACPLHPRCSSETRGGQGRTITASVYEPELQARKAFQTSPRAEQVLRSRSAIERLISHLVRLGMRHARFFRMLNVDLQAHVVAAAYNVQRYIALKFGRAARAAI